jgi:glycosyltransferase involved in cell wall biosynthesis
MRLLIITQKVDKDDPILGFFCRWIEEFAKHFEAVTVICLEEGRHELPANVKVLSLGKSNPPAGGEKVNSKNKVAFMRRFLVYIWRERKNYDAVFVHMNPIYLVLGGWFWKLSGKKVALWYTHKAVDLKLRVAERFADVIFTAAEESFTLKTTKKIVVGHGIDVAAYADRPRTKEIGAEPISIISVGRITPIKNCDTLVETARILKDKWALKGNGNEGGGHSRRFTVTFIGSPVTAADREYFNKIKVLVDKYDLNDIVSFAGDVKPDDMPAKYAAADISINLTPTGGLDKVVFESMASGVPVFTSNVAFRDYLGAYADRLIFKERDAGDLAEKLEAFIHADDKAVVAARLLSEVEKRSSLPTLIGKMVDTLSR